MQLAIHGDAHKIINELVPARPSLNDTARGKCQEQRRSGDETLIRTKRCLFRRVSTAATNKDLAATNKDFTALA